MSKPVLPEPHDLPNNPLAEAIFEVRWELSKGDALKPPEDPGYRILVGRYYDKIRKTYQASIDLPASQMPDSMLPYVVRQQFRASRDSWPVTQLGPGILTFNETTNYAWKSFRPNACMVIDALFDAYPIELHPLAISEANLRYLNSIPYDGDYAEQPLLTFIKNFLNTSIIVDPLLFGDNQNQADSPTNVVLSLTYDLAAFDGVGSLLIAKGEREGKPAIVWEIQVKTKQGYAPKTAVAIASWLEQAHEVAEKWFFLLCRGNLLDSFEGAHA
jgi:uncharacterized protein (TIGR04255 family)